VRKKKKGTRRGQLKHGPLCRAFGGNPFLSWGGRGNTGIGPPCVRALFGGRRKRRGHICNLFLGNGGSLQLHFDCLGNHGGDSSQAGGAPQISAGARGRKRSGFFWRIKTSARCSPGRRVKLIQASKAHRFGPGAPPRVSCPAGARRRARRVFRPPAAGRPGDQTNLPVSFNKGVRLAEKNNETGLLRQKFVPWASAQPGPGPKVRRDWIGESQKGTAKTRGCRKDFFGAWRAHFGTD